jgi:hypothetical protein
MAWNVSTLFKGTQASGTIIAIPVPIIAGCIGLHISWPDVVTAATLALQLSGFSADEVSLQAGGAGTALVGEGTALIAAADLQRWPDSGVVIAAVVAGAAGARLVNATNLRQRRARLLITSSAICTWDIKNGIMDV